MILLLACTAADPDPTPAGKDSAAGNDSAEPDRDDDERPVGDPALLCQAEMSCGSPILDEPKVPCTLTLTDGAGELMHDGMAMVEKRGRSSLEFPKPQYSVELHENVELLVWFANPWKYLDTGEAPAASWTSITYDDSDWASGTAPLGYGDDPTTTVSYGDDPDDKYITTWFRKSFDADPSGIAALRLGLQRDDGAVVYLNGTVIAVSNLDLEGLGPDTLAKYTVQEEFEYQWQKYDVDPALLVPGTNVLAVEVHQVEPTSSDLRFDAFLMATTNLVHANLFGFGAEDDWILNGVYIDRLLWRNKFAYDLFQSFGESDHDPERWGAEQAFCELTLNGEYQGVYVLGEAVRRDDERIDISEDDGTGQSFIVKLDDADGFRDNAVGYGEWRAMYPQVEFVGGDAPFEGPLVGIDQTLSAWEAEVLAGSEAQWDHLDLDSAVDWVIVEELTRNNDAYQLSVHMWKDTAGKLHLAPWDFDLTFGYPYYHCGADTWVEVREDYIEQWSASPAFQARFAERWAELRPGGLSEEALLVRIAGYEATLGEAIARNFERWPVEEIAFSWGDVDNWLCPASSWEEEHERVLAWIPERLRWIDENMGSY